MEEQRNENAVAEETQVFPLDDAAIGMIAELDGREKQLVEAARDINTARNSILSYFLRQHEMSGNWALAENRRELIRTPTPPAPAAE